GGCVQIALGTLGEGKASAQIQLVHRRGNALLGVRRRRYEQRRRESLCDRLGDIVLDLEHVVERAVDPVGPQLESASRVDQLRRDAEALPGAPYGAGERL